MLNITPYLPDDYQKLLPFLQRFDPSLNNADWEKLLGYEWENPLGYKGMLLENNGEIVGFLCYILSSKKLSGQEVTYCNISSWVVNPEFRSKSLQLLSSLFKIKNLVLVNLSPHENTLSIFNALRFEVFSEAEYRINPIKLHYVSLQSKKTELTCKEIDKEMMISLSLGPIVKKMIADHLTYSNVHFYELVIAKKERLILAFNQKQLFVKGIKNNIKELPYKLLNKTEQFELLYCSNPELLTEHFTGIFSELISKTKARSINISEHFLTKKGMQFSFAGKIKKDRPWFLYTDTGIHKNDIDILYTEKVLLNF